MSVVLASLAFAFATPTLQNVYRAGEGGYACFRLPALLRLPSADGKSLALYAEARNKSCSDYAPTDLVYKISRDLGATWSNLSVLCTDGCSDHDRAYHNSTSQPSPVAVPGRDGKEGFVVMLCNRGTHRRSLATRSHPAALPTRPFHPDLSNSSIRRSRASASSDGRLPLFSARRKRDVVSLPRPARDLVGAAQRHRGRQCRHRPDGRGTTSIGSPGGRGARQWRRRGFTE